MAIIDLPKKTAAAAPIYFGSQMDLSSHHIISKIAPNKLKWYFIWGKHFPKNGKKGPTNCAI